MATDGATDGVTVFSDGVTVFSDRAVELVESDIIPQSEVTEFYQLYRDLQDNDKIVAAIEDWLKNFSSSEFFDSYREKLESYLSESNTKIDEGEIGAGGTKSTTPPNQPSETVSKLFHNAMIKVTQSNNSGNIQSQPQKP